MMKVLVCGGRDFQDYDLLKTTLSALQVERGEFSLIIHGAAPGADMLADQYAGIHHIPVKAFPADWATYGRSAGPIRNAFMLDEGEPDLVVAFPGGSGTRNMVLQSRLASVEVIDLTKPTKDDEEGTA